MELREKYLWFTDTHLNLAWPFSINHLFHTVQTEKPAGIFITGDISDGKHVEYYLDKLASKLDCNIYFVLGNHDYHGRTLASVHSDIKRLSDRHSNLFWMTDSGVVSLTDEVAVIGTEGWYDARVGNPSWLKYTLDRLLTIDFNTLPSLETQVLVFKRLAHESGELIAKNLEKALQNHKVVYILTHFPPWKEATRDEGTLLEDFWLPYNTNTTMGDAIERVMKGRKKKKAVVLAGHTHTQADIMVGRNIQCRVAKSSYSGFHKRKERIYL